MPFDLIFFPGESIAISAEFDNHSSRTVIPYATLYQSQTFFASGKSRIRRTKFTVLTGLPVAPGTRGSWDSQLLKIPAVTPSIINCCVMKVDYYVKVSSFSNSSVDSKQDIFMVKTFVFHFYLIELEHLLPVTFTALHNSVYMKFTH